MNLLINPCCVNVQSFYSRFQKQGDRPSQATEVKTQWTTSSDVVGDRKNSNSKVAELEWNQQWCNRKEERILKCPTCCKLTKWPNTREDCILSCELLWADLRAKNKTRELRKGEVLVHCKLHLYKWNGLQATSSLDRFKHPDCVLQYIPRAP